MSCSLPPRVLLLDIKSDNLLENSHLITFLFVRWPAPVLEHSVMYPFDAIKTRMQILSPSPAAIYTSISSAFSRILTTEGFSSLWRGVGSVVLGAGPAHAIYFSVYEEAKERLKGSGWATKVLGEQGHHASHAAAGACAVIAHDAFMNPFDGWFFLGGAKGSGSKCFVSVD